LKLELQGFSEHRAIEQRFRRGHNGYGEYV
jgi:hypothetical protein